jgi:hypothetical protein
MASNMIKRFSTFNSNDLVFSTLKKNKNGGKAVYINAQGNKKTYIQLPFMKCPYGLSAYTDEATNKTTYSLDLSLDDSSPETAQVRSEFENLDNIIVDIVSKNSQDWLGKKYNVAVLKEALYKPIVRPSKKEEYAPTMKLKILTKQDGSFVPEAYNLKKDSVSLDSLEKGSMCMCIVDINQIWFIDNKFGVSIRLSQVLCKSSEKLPSFAFQGVETEEVDEDEEVEAEAEVSEVDQ